MKTDLFTIRPIARNMWRDYSGRLYHDWKKSIYQYEHLNSDKDKLLEAISG